MIEEPTFMSFVRRPSAASLCAVLAAGSLVLSAAPALAVTGGTPVAASDTTYAYTAKITVGAHDRGCTAVLVDPEWLLTAASCFADDPAASLAVPAASPPRRRPPSSAAPTSPAPRAPSAVSSRSCRARTVTWCWPASAYPSPA